MKINLNQSLGKFLMRISSIKICIVDDEEIYFDKQMIELAKLNGFKNIERYTKIDSDLFEDLQKSPRDIVILDIQGITSPEVAKDGLQIASSLSKNTSSYIVVTSAHQFHLSNKLTKVDYVIEDRLLTQVDFLDTLIQITEDYLEKKTTFYKKVAFKVGFGLVKQGVT